MKLATRRTVVALGMAVGLAFVLLVTSLSATEKKVPDESPFRTPKHQYTGVKGCKTCHQKEKLGGEEYIAWAKLKHAKAYETLGGEAAKKIAKERGIADPQKAPECLKCHTTGYGVEKKWLAKTHTLEEGVSCEACHGPGKDYKSKKVMEDHEECLKQGMVIPTEVTCVACHNEESPTYKEFDYKKMLPKIKHWKDE